MPPHTTNKTEHDMIVKERRRYRIEKVPGEVNKIRTGVADRRTHTGDTTREYYDNVPIREHNLTIVMQKSDNERFADEPTPVFVTRWLIDAAQIPNLPKVIVDGSWSDPAQTFLAGNGCKPTAPVGSWGIYARDFTDTYSLSQIKPLQTQYKNIHAAMLSTRDTLYIAENFYPEHGLIDNLPQVMQQLKSWSDECQQRILTTQAQLAPFTTTPHKHDHPLAHPATTPLALNLTRLSLLNQT
jgi:hypothetical protein